jgi:1-deoxy-D-xylulose-5-phosphate reductoisomerase
MKKVAIFGSTGSVGRTALNVIQHLSSELKVSVLAARGSNLDLLEAQARKFRPFLVAIGDAALIKEWQKRCPMIPAVGGEEGLCEAAAFAGTDQVLLAMSGVTGIKPALSAIEAGKPIALANKEILVCAGALIMQAVQEKGVSLLPVDSEHSAIFQCLERSNFQAVRRLILTASGGPFHNYTEKMLSTITVGQALAHPKWRMGAKITVDSSTLMNKGLELIEAHHLFNIAPSAIDIVVHPESIIHSFVEYCDGAVLAQLSEPDMALSVQYALTWPERKPSLLPSLDLLKHSRLTFESPDRKKFPCLSLAEQAARLGRSYPCFLNAANEVLVEQFLQGQIQWQEIAVRLEKLMSFHHPCDVIDLGTVLAVDRQAREVARER